MSNNINQQKEDLKAIIEMGLRVQGVAVAATYAIKTSKQEFLKQLNELLVNFINSLSETEKQDLRKDMDVMMETKAEEFLINLGINLNDQEMTEAVKMLKSLQVA